MNQNHWYYCQTIIFHLAKIELCAFSFFRLSLPLPLQQLDSLALQMPFALFCHIQNASYSITISWVIFVNYTISLKIWVNENKKKTCSKIDWRFTFSMNINSIQNNSFLPNELILKRNTCKKSTNQFVWFVCSLASCEWNDAKIVVCWNRLALS